MNWGKPSLNRSGSGQLQGSRRSQDSRTTSRRAATSRASHGKASAPSEKLMRCRCKKLSHCSTIARARRSTIRLESTNSREVAQKNPKCLAQEISRSPIRALADQPNRPLTNFSTLCAGRHAPWTRNFSRSHHAVIRVYDDAGNVIETSEHAGDLKEW